MQMKIKTRVFNEREKNDFKNSRQKNQTSFKTKIGMGSIKNYKNHFFVKGFSVKGFCFMNFVEFAPSFYADPMCYKSRHFFYSFTRHQSCLR